VAALSGLTVAAAVDAAAASMAHQAGEEVRLSANPASIVKNNGKQRIYNARTLRFRVGISSGAVPGSALIGTIRSRMKTPIVALPSRSALRRTGKPGISAQLSFSHFAS
jgi:hypothetical protein